MWRYRSGLRLLRHQAIIRISEVPWHSSEAIIIRRSEDINDWKMIENRILKSHPYLAGAIDLIPHINNFSISIFLLRRYRKWQGSLVPAYQRYNASQEIVCIPGIGHARKYSVVSSFLYDILGRNENSLQWCYIRSWRLTMGLFTNGLFNHSMMKEWKIYFVDHYFCYHNNFHN